MQKIVVKNHRRPIWSIAATFLLWNMHCKAEPVSKCETPSACFTFTLCQDIFSNGRVIMEDQLALLTTTELYCVMQVRLRRHGSENSVWRKCNKSLHLKAFEHGRRLRSSQFDRRSVCTADCRICGFSELKHSRSKGWAFLLPRGKKKTHKKTNNNKSRLWHSVHVGEAVEKVWL